MEGRREREKLETCLQKRVALKVAIKVVIVLEKFREKKCIQDIFSQSRAFKCKEMECLPELHPGTHQGLQFQKDTRICA